MDLENKIALITGGARGLGLSITKELLRGGVKHVAILDLGTSDGEESAKKLNSEFGEGRVIFIATDVTKASDFEAAFAKTVKEFGGLDIVVNNAGIINEPQWELTVDVNVNGVIRGTFLGLQYMGKHKGGKGGVIVNIASIFGLDPFIWIPVYTATKHAVIGFGKCFGTPFYYEKTGVRVLTLGPGISDTQMAVDFPKFVSELVDLEVALKDQKNYSIQNPDNIGRGVAQIIRSAKNGTIWIAEGDEPAHEVSIPDRFSMKVSPK